MKPIFPETFIGDMFFFPVGTRPGPPVRRNNDFSTWMERCEALLEAQDEANYLAKKQ